MAINGTPSYCDVRLCGKKKKLFVKFILKPVIKILIEVIYKRNVVNQIVQSAPERFRIFSNSFDSERVGTLSINEETGVAVLHVCSHGKGSSYIPISEVIRSCSNGYISLKSSTGICAKR